MSVVLLMTLLVSCGTVDVFLPGEDCERLYFYGVKRSSGNYYACVTETYSESPADSELRYVPLAEEIVASFQPNGLVGAWSPTECYSPAALSRAYRKGEITEGAVFYFTMIEGKMTALYEDNYYEGNDVTGGA